MKDGYLVVCGMKDGYLVVCDEGWIPGGICFLMKDGYLVVCV